MAIELKKSGDTHRIDLKKHSSSNRGEIIINLDWSKGKTEQGFFSFFKKQQIDLDLGCFYELRDGSRELIDGVQFSHGQGGPRNVQTRQGCYTKAPFIWHNGDDRGVSSMSGEVISVNPDGINVIKRMIIYTFIYDGVARWSESDAVVKVIVPNADIVEVKMGQQTSDKDFCAIAQLDFGGDDSITVKKLVTFHDGHEDCDRYYDWGFSYSSGSKD